MGVADRNTFAGVVRAHIAAKDSGVRFFVGVRLVTADGFETIVYPMNRGAYGRLCRLLTLGNRRAKKGECLFSFEEIPNFSEGQIFIVLPPAELEIERNTPPPPAGEVLSLSEARAKRRGQLPDSAPSAASRSLSPVNGGGADNFTRRLQCLLAIAPGRVYLGSTALYGDRATKRLAKLAAFAREMRMPLVATNDVHYHVPARQMLQDVLTCIREKCTIDEAGKRLAPNVERHLKSQKEMARLFAKYPDALARTMEIASRIDFSLDELKYEYPAVRRKIDISATAIRNRVANGQSIRYLVPDVVAQIIRRENLYQGTNR